jgi:hypothetical protein
MESGETFYGGLFTPKLVRQVIGESIPPLAMYNIVNRLKHLDKRVLFSSERKSTKVSFQSRLPVVIEKEVR